VNDLIETAYASSIRPRLFGARGAVSAAHPFGSAAAQHILALGGNAVDAAIAAQAVLCVVIPASCGLGGDALVLICGADGETVAVNGTGCAPSDPAFQEARDGGLAATVPGMVDAWQVMAERFGRVGLEACLAPAIELAQRGVRFGADISRAVHQNKARLECGGAAGWAVCQGAGSGQSVVQPQLGRLLRAIGKTGGHAFYLGDIAKAVECAVAACGGLLTARDLGAHETVVTAPVSTGWQNGRVSVQPPITQGVLLALCLKNLEALGALPDRQLDHALIELTNASFAHRDRVGEGAALLDVSLDVDLDKASNRAGPRAYLHTAGVATADAEGQVVSSLVSLFDEFGSCVFVPEGGFVLNNRAQGFTQAPNDAGPGKRPVHTLAPAIFEMDGEVAALATPGADGQIQTLLQVITKARLQGMPLTEAIHHPRWRSENGKLLIAENHPEKAALEALGHNMIERADGDTCFGGVVCAGIRQGAPFAVSDWRREVWSGVS